MKNRVKFSFIICLCMLFSLAVHAKDGDDKIRVACVGNSITYGYLLDNPFQQAFPGVLQQFLGTGYEVRNFGYSARTLLNKGDLPYMHEYMYQEAKAFAPHIVTIKLGTNDSKPKNWIHKADFEKDLTTMVEEFQALPSKPKVYLCLPAPAPKVEENLEINDSTITRYIIPIIKRVARKKHLEVIDLHSVLMPYYPGQFIDGIHPNPTGAVKIAQEVYEKITHKEAPEYDSQRAFPGVKSTRHGCDRYDFVFYGREATVVVPKKAAPGNPWVWRPAFFDAFPGIDDALLDRGFHLAYLDLTHLYGTPRAVSMGNEFYYTMTGVYHLSPKVVVEGLSRGGYYAFNWAAANPDKVACLYVDAPVCDLTSWPGRNSELWKDVLDEWDVADEEVTSSFKGNALQLLPTLREANIPIIGVCGDSDKTVPYEENFKPVRDAYAAMGGVVELILKPGCDHHPHGLENPEPVVDFITRYQKGFQEQQHIHYRDAIVNSFIRFQNEKKGCVAYLGGSITEMKGWAEQVSDDLKQRFPYTDFTFIKAGIASTGSTPHAFRLEQDVLSKGVPDLLFVEAAVNDATNGFTATEQVRALEGIVRHLRTINPNMDIVMLHFIDDPFIASLHRDIIPDVILNHERVANAYRITSIDLCTEIFERLQTKELDWGVFGGTHPSWYGHSFYTAAIATLFDHTAALTPDAVIKPHTLPQNKMDAFCYDKGHFLSIQEAEKLKGFAYVADWMPRTYTDKEVRNGFHHVPMLESVKSGASFQLKFTGRAIGLFGVFGPGSGILEYQIDGGDYKTIDTHTAWSNYLYIPWVYMLETELEPAEHVLKVRMRKGSGDECQIRNFVVNE